ncbi:Predicted dehydrogenase [Clostridium amylolyticum]|uniref:Predicted dehydrogenase n=1 Tax=Clostridium amylolyticum TaxID=1121298 RepID=A0A1M6GUS2_9CLOT|nr:Gfo/Idh/MocA family oxidoreductase [Clostridium amylolyticum]SHJ13655.1 Predicted dehydrogenase [Clostridium amylolyticum]
MLKVGIIGLGFMGGGHLAKYQQLEKEGFPVELVAICDVDESKLKGKAVEGNLEVGKSKYDLSKYRLYTNMDEMLEKEELDYVDIALPTYLHAEATIKALNKGLHVLCEKPMALNVQECQSMIDAAKKNNKKLMIGQCLRFEPAYVVLKDYVDNKKLGEVTCAYFFRGGTTPIWSFENWLLKKEKSGGAMLDQHIHDVDTISWLFGKPEKVSSLGKVVAKESGYDAVSTNYLFKDDKVVNAQDDWTLNGGYGFRQIYRVNFEKGNLIFENGKVTVHENQGEKFDIELDKEDGYYREIKYFATCVMEDREIEIATPETSKLSVAIVRVEIDSADNRGEFKEIF